MNIATALRDLEVAELQEFLARDDLLAFTQMFTADYLAGWVHREIADELMQVVHQVEARESPRLMLFMPPGHGKSQLVSRCLPAWTFGRHPAWELVCSTYGQDLSSDLGAKVRGIMREVRYRSVFHDVDLDDSAQAKDHFDTTKGGTYRAVGVGGALSGRRAHLLIVDDPVKGREAAESAAYQAMAWDWWSSVARTRLYPGGGVVLLMTRYHQLDLAGRILERAEAGGEKWRVITYPAIAREDEQHRKRGEALHPERYSLKDLESLRLTIDPRDWNALYQQNPVPDDGIYYNARDFHVINRTPKHLNCYITTDLALGAKSGNDYTVLLPGGVSPDDDLVLIPGAVRRRMDALETACRLLQLADEVDAQFITLPNDHMGRTLRPFLEKLMEGAEDDDAVRVGSVDFEIPRRFYAIEMLPVVQDKVARSAAFHARQRMGKVKWVDCPFYREEARPELLQFPAGKHDDIADCCADFGRLLELLDAARGPKKNEREWTKPKRWERRTRRDDTPALQPLFGGDDGGKDLFTR